MPDWLRKCSRGPPRNLYILGINIQADAFISELDRHSPLPSMTSMKMFNITRSVTLATLFACLLQLSLGATIPTRTVKENNIAAQRAATKRAPLTSAARLRQTNAREIRARNVIRNDPLYKRQQSSARVYPTCSADFAPLLTSARYVGSDMAGGMVSLLGPGRIRFPGSR